MFDNDVFNVDKQARTVSLVDPARMAQLRAQRLPFINRFAAPAGGPASGPAGASAGAPPPASPRTSPIYVWSSDKSRSGKRIYLPVSSVGASITGLTCTSSAVGGLFICLFVPFFT